MVAPFKAQIWYPFFLLFFFCTALAPKLSISILNLMKVVLVMEKRYDKMAIGDKYPNLRPPPLTKHSLGTQPATVWTARLSSRDPFKPPRNSIPCHSMKTRQSPVIRQEQLKPLSTVRMIIYSWSPWRCQWQCSVFETISRFLIATATSKKLFFLFTWHPPLTCPTLPQSVLHRFQHAPKFRS